MMNFKGDLPKPDKLKAKNKLIEKDCILFATADWNEPYWTNKQHMACELAKRGIRILYVESVGLRVPKASSIKDFKRLWRRLVCGVKAMIHGPVNKQDNIWVLAPFLIPIKHHWPMIKWINRELMHFYLHRFVKNESFDKPIIWTYHPYMLEAIARFDHGPVLYHCVDNLAAIPGVNVTFFQECEIRLLKMCKLVFTTSKALAEHCAYYNDDVTFLPNVVDADHFGKALEKAPLPPEFKDIPQPRLNYHGVLSDFKVDFKLLYDAACLRPDWQWIIIGEEREGQKNDKVRKLKTLLNVHFLGYRSYTQLPNYLRAMSVGLLPTLINEYTGSMFPMKYFEYIAAGLPVVSTSLDFTSDGIYELEVADSAEMFVQAIERQLERGRYNQCEINALLADNNWHERTNKMLEKLLALEID